jgi:hypothetical protein
MENKIASITDPGFTPTPPNEIENKIVKGNLVDNPVSQEYVPEYSPRVEVQPPVLQAPKAQPQNLEEYSDSEDEAKAPPRPPIIGLNERNKKRNGKAVKTKIVIEQSSDDEDEFHPHEHVIFVKRKSKNDSKAKVIESKTIPAATPAPPTSPVRNRSDIPPPLHPQQALRQLPTYPVGNVMDDFVNQGFANYRKYY